MNQKNQLQTPFGVLDFTPTEAHQLHELAQKVQSVFKSAGYSLVKTPSIEYYNSLEHSLGDTLKANCIKFFNDSGELLVLRPDHTTPIARLVATRMANGPFPLNLCYSDPIFRRETDALQKTEIFQAGVEHIGENSPEADADMISLCIETLLALGYSEFGIDIGHIDFLKELNADQKKALLKGDFLSVGFIPKRGKAECVADHAHLTQVAAILQKRGHDRYIHFNRGLVKKIYYYTGLIFEAYIPGIREVVCSGGRYDKLLSAFGLDQPAVGFGLNLSVLQEGI